MGHLAGFQGVIFDGVGGPDDVRVFKSRNGVDKFELNVKRKGG